MFNEIFQTGRVAAIAGNRHQGKTNNIVCMILEFRKTNKTTPIYTYGLPPQVSQFLKKHNVKTIDSVKQLANKKNSILILDEFQKLKLNDRRHKDVLIELMAMIYHPESNNYVLFCSPTTREYTSIIGGFIEIWLLKSMFVSDCVNGSQLKQALNDYKGQFYKLGYYDIPKHQMVLLNDEMEQILTFEYVKDIDTKQNIVDPLAPDEKLSEKKDSELSRNCQKKSHKIVRKKGAKPFITIVKNEKV